MKTQTRLIGLALLLVMTLALAACGPSALPETSPPEPVAENSGEVGGMPADNDREDPPPQSESASPAPPAEESYPAPEGEIRPGTAADSPTPESYPAPTEGAQPTPRAELAATDPATVELASGNLQLVELFAFW